MDMGRPGFFATSSLASVASLHLGEEEEKKILADNFEEMIKRW